MPRVVTFHYTLRDPNGRVVDTSAGGEPVTYLEGAGQIIDGLDEQLRLAMAGEKSRVQVGAARAYGERDPAQVQRVKRTVLPVDGELQVGDQFKTDTDRFAPGVIRRFRMNQNIFPRKRRLPMALLVAISFVTADPVARAAGALPPNILLLFIDNVGYGDLGCYGNAAVKTPNMDRLAAEGVRCTDFYIGSPSCAPSRGAILTGRHPERTGFNYQNLNYQRIAGKNTGGDGLPRSEKIIPYHLKPLGYATGAFGKWNVGFAPGSRPTERGFDEFLGFEGGNIHYYKHLYHGQNDMRRGTEPVDLRGRYSTDLFADTAIDFIRKHRDRPWFVYLPFNAVHGVLRGNVEPGEKIEWQVPAKYLALYGLAPDEPDEKKRFRAVLTALDDAIGRVLNAVDDLGQRQRTVVLCISDNGAFPNLLEGTGTGEQSNAPFRSGGGTTYEGGVRVPAIFRWPGRFKPGTTCREMLSSLDVLPMIVAAAGGRPPDGRGIDGRSPIATLAGESPSPHPALHWVWDPSASQQWRAMREGNFKVVRSSNKSQWELYDLAKDPGEANDLAKTRPDLARALAGKFETWHAAVKASAR